MISKHSMDNAMYYYGFARRFMPFFLRRPLGFFLYITEKCDLNCTYCWQREEEMKMQHGNRLPLKADEWMKIVDKLPGGSFLGLSGGEATVSPSFGPIVQHAGRRFPLSINSNGAHLQDKHISILTSGSVRNISISLDGFADIHDRNRAMPGLFNTIVRNIGKINMARTRKTSLTIKTVLTDDNLDLLEEFRTFCSDILRANTLNISFMKTGEHAQFSFNHMDDLKELLKTKSAFLHEYRDTGKVVDVLTSLLHNNRKSGCEVTLYPQVSTRAGIARLLARKGRGVYRTCYFPLSAVVVLPDGEVIPCMSYRLGNLRAYDYDINKLLAGERYRMFCKEVYAFKGELPPNCTGCCFLKVRE